MVFQMVTRSHDERALRALSLTQIILERFSRAGLTSIPFVGSALEQVTFGIRDSQENERLKELLNVLSRQVTALANTHNDLVSDEWKTSTLPQAESLRQVFLRLSAPEYDAVENAVVLMLDTKLSLTAASTGGTHGEIITARKIMESIIDADRALQLRIEQLRGLSKLWADDLRANKATGDFLDVVRSLHKEVANGVGGEPRHIWFFDSSVVYCAIDSLREPIDAQMTGFLFSYLSSHGSIDRMGILPRQFFELETIIGRVDNRRSFSILQRALEYFEIFKTWKSQWDRFLPVVDSARTGVPIIYEALRKDSPRSPHLRHGYIANSLALLNAYNQRATMDQPRASFVTSNRRLLRLTLKDFTNPTQHIYGPAWRAYVRESDVSGDRNLGKDITSVVELMEVSNLSYLDPTSMSKDQVNFFLPALEKFWEFLEPFHNAIADHIDKKRSDELHSIEPWLEYTFEGSKRFDGLYREIQNEFGTDDKGAPK
jgi:hypothetical protein